MNIIRKAIYQGICLSFVFVAAPLMADDHQILVVSSNPEVTELTRAQLRQIYLENGVSYGVKPLNLKSGAKERTIFNTKVIGLTESRLRSYWMQKKFTGRGKPPKEFDSVEELIDFLKENPGFIGYVSEEANMPESLQVVYSVES